MADYTRVHTGLELDQAIKGAFITVASIAERDAIDMTGGRRVDGVIVKVQADGNYYTWNGSAWVMADIAKTNDAPVPIYVSAVNGNDANNGTYGNPIKSFTRLKAIAYAGAQIFLERGSVWDADVEVSGGIVVESATQTKVEAGDSCLTLDATLKTCKISSYGVGALPQIRLSNEIPSSAVSLDSGNLYTFTVEGKYSDNMHQIGEALGLDRCYPFILIDGEQLARVADKPTADSTPGSFYVTAIGDEWTYYVHGFNSENLISVPMETGFKSRPFNNFSDRDVFAEIEDLHIFGCCQKDGPYFDNTVINNLFIENSVVHHCLFGVNATVYNYRAYSNKLDTLFEGVEFFTFDYTDSIKIKNADIGTPNVPVLGVFSHSSNNGGIDEVIFDNIAVGNTSSPMVFNDTKSVYLRGLNSVASTSFIDKRINISNYGGVGAPARGVLFVCDSIGNKPFFDGDLLSNFMLRFNIPHDITLQNVYTSLSIISAFAGTPYTTVNLAGTILNYINSTILFDERCLVFKLSSVTSGVAQNIEVNMVNSVLARPTYKEQGDIFDPDEALVCFDSTDLPNSGVLSFSADSNSMIEKMFIKNGSGYLTTLAALQAAFPGQVDSGFRYGVKEVDYNDAGNTFSTISTIGPVASLPEDPDNSSNYLVTVQAPNTDMLIYPNNVSGTFSFTPQFNVSWNSGAQVIGIKINLSNVYSTNALGTTGSVKATTWDEFNEMVLGGYLTLSIPKTELADDDVFTFRYVTWDYDGNYKRSELSNGVAIGGTILDNSIGYDPNRRTQNPKFNF